MISAVFKRRGGQIVAFAVEGHAGQAPHGQDLVCAAVSALTQAVVVGLNGVVGVQAATHKESGVLRCTIPAGLEPRQRAGATVLLETLLLSLRSLEQDYGDALHVRETSGGGGMDALH